MRGWNRRLWGAVFTGKGSCFLVGEAWKHRRSEAYPGEPSRALLFSTRQQARTFCAEKTAKYASYPEGHVCRDWTMTPVAVRERVTVVR